MNEERALSQALHLEQLMDEKQRSRSQVLELAGLYRNLSAALPDARAEHTRRRLEDVLLRAHRLLSARREGVRPFLDYVFRTLPVTTFRSPYVRFSVLLFYSVFFASAVGAYQSRDYAVAVLGEASLAQYVEMHKNPDRQFSAGQGFAGTGYYIVNNITLDLLGYATGLLAGVGSVFFTIYNGVFLGTTIGYLLQTEAQAGILQWIFGHAPFELTAVGFSAGAGLQTGLAFLRPGQRTRAAAMAAEGREALPALLAAVILTGVAAFIEGFLAPVKLPLPVKMAVGGACLVFLLAYFVMPSLPSRPARGTSA